MDLDEKIVKGLVATGKWSERTARLGIRAKFTCEYCGKDLLSCPDDYKLWQVDHIVPTSKGGHPSDLENLAIACRQCNMDFKSRWNPLEDISIENPTRQDLIESVRAYISKRRAITKEEVEIVRGIVGYCPEAP